MASARGAMRVDLELEVPDPDLFWIAVDVGAIASPICLSNCCTSCLIYF